MKKPSFTVKHSIFINKPREIVWDYTQNYDFRPDWDKTVLETTVLQTTPNRIVKLKLRGNATMTFVYKLDQRPLKTTLTAKDIISPFFESAGGSWNYEEYNSGTIWTQTNTVLFKRNLLTKILQPLYRFMIKNQIRKSMKMAKQKIERSN